MNEETILREIRSLTRQLAYQKSVLSTLTWTQPVILDPNALDKKGMLLSNLAIKPNENEINHLNTFLTLRAMKGVVQALDTEAQYIINLGLDLYSNYGLRIERENTLVAKSTLSPCFSSYDHARKAIVYIGTERIIKAFQWLMQTLK